MGGDNDHLGRPAARLPPNATAICCHAGCARDGKEAGRTVPQSVARADAVRLPA